MKKEYQGLSKKDLIEIIESYKDEVGSVAHVPEYFNFDVGLKDYHKTIFPNLQSKFEQLILDGATKEEVENILLNNNKDTKENNMNELEMKIKSEELECELLSLKLEQKKIKVKRLKESDTSIEAQLKNMEKSKTPIIIKSGDTKVAYFCGVDYLFIPTYQCSDVGYNWTAESFKDLIKEGTFKPISEIKITDEIAKLRPMVTTDYLSEPCILWAIDKTGMSHYETGGCNVKALKLATVKDLTTK